MTFEQNSEGHHYGKSYLAHLETQLVKELQTAPIPLLIETGEKTIDKLITKIQLLNQTFQSSAFILIKAKIVHSEDYLIF